MAKLFLIASGGGHTGFALAVGLRVKELKPDTRTVYIVPRNDKWSIYRILRVDPEAEIREVTKPLKPLEPYIFLLKRFMKSFIESIRSLEHAVLFCSGSNHSLLPALISRYLHRSITFCVEDVFRFKKRSKTLDLLYKFARINVFVQWPEQRKLYSEKSIYAGVLFEKPLYPVRDKGYILVITGTVGNRYLLKLLLKTRLENLVIQTGALDPKLLRRKEWKVFRFDPDIDKLIANASLVISAPGITVINVTQAYRKPAVMVHNPDFTITADYYETKRVADYLGIPFIDPRKISPSEFEKIIENSYNIRPRKLRDGGYFIAKYLLKYID